MIEIGLSSIFYIMTFIFKSIFIILMILGICACISSIISSVKYIKEIGKDYIKNSRFEDAIIILECSLLICFLVALIFVVSGIITINMYK